MEPSSDLANKREKLLELDKKKKAIEADIVSLTEALNSPGMPGVSAPLVDKEGFPLPGIDIYSIRTMRNKLTHLKNDHTALMKEIDKKLRELHAAYREEAESKAEPMKDKEEIKK